MYILFLKKYIKRIYYKLINISFNPYFLKYQIFKPIDISDFFVWSACFDDNIFVAENIYALLKGKKYEVTHIFKFYSPNGKFVKEFEFKSSDYFAKVSLPKSLNKYKYLSFTHFIKSNNTLKNALQNKKINTLKFATQNRGYTLYSNKNNKIHSAVHGNFGGISYNSTKTAIQRGYFIYTPIYEFKKNFNYDLVFNNPTDKELKIKIIFLGTSRKKEISILSMGTKYLVLKKYQGGISIESKLPICRPLIYKNSLDSNQNYDVFHG